MGFNSGFKRLMRLEQATIPKPCKLYDDDDDDNMSTYHNLVVYFFWGFPPHNFINERSITKVNNY